MSILKKLKVRFSCHPLSPGAGIWGRRSWDSKVNSVFHMCFRTALDVRSEIQHRWKHVDSDGRAQEVSDNRYKGSKGQRRFLASMESWWAPSIYIHCECYFILCLIDVFWFLDFWGGWKWNKVIALSIKKVLHKPRAHWVLHFKWVQQK